MLTEDIEAGAGELKLRQTDLSRFQVGSTSPTRRGRSGAFRNDLIELIQYAPMTDTVLRRPLLIVPPWINKYYILDLNPEKSFIRWAVSQGLTVFCISWVNPDERHAGKGFDDYMREGVIAAVDAVEAATGERQIATIGYCVGGTLLAVALAYMAATGDHRVDGATLFTTQVDFSKAGDLKVFLTEDDIKHVEADDGGEATSTAPRWRAPSTSCARTTSSCPTSSTTTSAARRRSRSTCCTGTPISTRMPCANHSFYLRRCYLENGLVKGDMVIGNVRIDLGQVEDPDLQPGGPRGPHRAGAVGVPRLEGIRRPGRVRARRLGAHRRHRQPAREGEVPVLDQRPARG